MQRTGSTLLCELLKSSGLAGNPDEYFLLVREEEFAARWNVSTFEDYFHAAIAAGTGGNGVFGNKMMSPYLHDLVDRLRPLFGLRYRGSAAEVLCTAFPRLQYIWITRRDRVRQAISLHRALATKIWTSDDEIVTHRGETSFDFQAIEHLVRQLQAEENAWREYFEVNHIQPFTVVYEDLIQAPEETTMQILRYLDIPFREPLELGPPRLRKQADALTEEWVERYRAQSSQLRAQ